MKQQDPNPKFDWTDAVFLFVIGLLILGSFAVLWSDMTYQLIYEMFLRLHYRM